MATAASCGKRRLGIALVILFALGAQTQAQAPPTSAEVLAMAEQSVVDAEKALEAAAPVAYKALQSAMRARNAARALVAAERAKPAEPKPETSPK